MEVLGQKPLSLSPLSVCICLSLQITAATIINASCTKEKLQSDISESRGISKTVLFKQSLKTTKKLII